MNITRILILEDNIDHLELLTHIINEHFTPVDIHTVESIEDCLDFLEEISYDVVITDASISGLPISDRLKELVKVAGETPVIVISGSGDENQAAQAIKDGAKEYITKSKETLLTIHEILNRQLQKSRTKQKSMSRPTPYREDSSVDFLREIDRLTQRARSITTNMIAPSSSKMADELDSLFSQIKKLRELATKMGPK